MMITFRCVKNLRRLGLSWVSLLMLAGCAVEVENPGQPDTKPIKGDAKQSTTSTESSPSGETGSTQTDKPPSILEQHPSAIAVPSTLCTLNITRGGDNSATVDGAQVSLSNEQISGGALLVRRDTVTNRFVNAASAPLPTGPVNLEYYPAKGPNCRVELAIESAEVSQKIKITVQPSLPDWNDNER